MSRALGIKKDTLRSWESSETTRVRSESLRRVDLLLQACREAEEHMGSAEAVGRWVTTETPQLEGKSPADVLLEEGDDGLERVRLSMLPPTPSATSLRPEVRDEMLAALSPGVRAIYESAIQRVTASSVA